MVDSNDRDRIVEARDELHRMLSEVSHAVMHHFEFGCGVNTEEDVGVDPILWGSGVSEVCWLFTTGKCLQNVHVA